MAIEVGIDFGDIMSGDVDFFLYDYDPADTSETPGRT